MKLTRMHLRGHHRFKDFGLDLTYPEGHARAGRPLDKVCFLGQSGTGKTTLLKVVKHLLHATDQWKAAPVRPTMEIEVEMGRHKDVLFQEPGDPELYTRDAPAWARGNAEDVAYDQVYKPRALYFPAETLEAVTLSLTREPFENPLHYLKTEGEIRKKVERERETLKKKCVWDFSVDNPVDLWKGVLMDVRDYREEEARYQARLSKRMLDGLDFASELARYRTWKNEQPNPMARLAAVLNPLLEVFRLRVVEDPETPEERRFIAIEQTDGAAVPYSAWSTGTRQLIFTFTPLFFLNTSQSVVLIDEPERSLYPDVQRRIVSAFSAVAPDAQFFYATHSPVIASNFDPWEVIELDFDQDGHVIHRRDWEKTRHVDHYKHFPRHLRWDAILRHYFGMDSEGNPEREQALQRLSMRDGRRQKRG